MTDQHNTGPGKGRSIEDLIGEALTPDTPFFTVKSANQWLLSAQQKDPCKQLFGGFWHENELCILFGDTGTGKSILAYQVADSISTGKPTGIAALQVPEQTTLYLDCELSEKQMEARYSVEYTQHYNFGERFIRAEINPDGVTPLTIDYEAYMALQMEEMIVQSGATVVVVDNLTYLKNETEKAKDALGLMKHLKNLKNRYNLSILVLAHTPKRDLTKPITRNDLAGSKALINFCDSAFAIGESSQDKSLRYLKQIKARNTEIVHDTQNVCLCSVVKEHNFLSFQYINCDCESLHLKELSEKDRTERQTEVKRLNAEGQTQRQIADALNIPLTTVNRYLKKK